MSEPENNVDRTKALIELYVEQVGMFVDEAVSKRSMQLLEDSLCLLLMSLSP